MMRRRLPASVWLKMSAVFIVTFVAFVWMACALVFGWQTTHALIYESVFPVVAPLVLVRGAAMPDKIVCISLPGVPQRRNYMQQQLAAFPRELWSFWNALTPADVTPELNATYSFTTTRLIAACALSHVLLWKHLAEDASPALATLVVEDDVTLPATVMTTLAELAAPLNFDVIAVAEQDQFVEARSFLDHLFLLAC